MYDDQKLLTYLELQKDLHLWEKASLPFVKSNAGYELFFQISIAAIEKKDVRLKNIYHSLPYSEKTLRLVLRELEDDGWIKLSKKERDMRYREMTITPKFFYILNSWMEKIEQLAEKTTVIEPTY